MDCMTNPGSQDATGGALVTCVFVFGLATAVPVGPVYLPHVLEHSIGERTCTRLNRRHPPAGGAGGRYSKHSAVGLPNLRILYWVLITGAWSNWNSSRFPLSRRRATLEGVLPFSTRVPRVLRVSPTLRESMTHRSRHAPCIRAGPDSNIFVAWQAGTEVYTASHETRYTKRQFPLSCIQRDNG